MSASSIDYSEAKEGSSYCLLWQRPGPEVSRADYIESHQRPQARNYLYFLCAAWQEREATMDGWCAWGQP